MFKKWNKTKQNKKNETWSTTISSDQELSETVN